jgi:hypothetical protein
MMDRAKAYGLKYFDTQRTLLIDPQVNPIDKLNDSRKGIAGYYRYKPRNIAEIYSALPYKRSIRRDLSHIRTLLTGRRDPQEEIIADLHPSLHYVPPPPPKPAVAPQLSTIHDSVFNRIQSGTDRYAPVVVPAAYKFTGKAGTITDALHPIDPGRPRSSVQDDGWNWVWLRRVVYFLTVFASLFVAAIPFLVIYHPGVGRDSVGPVVVPIVNAAASFLPSMLQPWFDAFRNAPGFVLVGVIAIALFMGIGSALQQKIRNVMRLAWHSPVGYKELTGWHKFVYWLRRRGGYRAFFYLLKNWIFPAGIAIWLFWWLAFGTANVLGLICKGGGGIEVTEQEASSLYPMQTKNICNATGLKVTHKETYRITLKVGEPWLDNTHATDPNGFNNRQASWTQLWGVPYKRLIWSNWFATILRVGGPGLEEHLLDLKPGANGEWTTTFEPRSDGEVFLYVNDTAIGLPWIYDLFYRLNNHGTAEIKLTKIKR